MPVIIRRLNPGEAALYRSVRLESLKESPEAFASTYEAALERSEESWSQQADNSSTGSDRATFIILADHPVGVAALYRNPEKPDEGEMIQVWVSPEHRGGPLAGELMSALFQWASQNDFRIIMAEVTPDNSRALRFYEKHGFVQISQPAGSGGKGPILSLKIEPAP